MATLVGRGLTGGALEYAVVKSFGVNYIQADAMIRAYTGQETARAAGILGGAADPTGDPLAQMLLGAGERVGQTGTRFRTAAGKVRAGLLGVDPGEDSLLRSVKRSRSTGQKSLWEIMAEDLSEPGAGAFMNLLDPQQQAFAGTVSKAFDQGKIGRRSTLLQDLLPALALEQAVERGMVQPSEPEMEMLQKYKSQFQTLRNVISEVGGSLTPADMKLLERAINKANEDEISGFNSIVDMLAGIVAALESDTMTDTGQTEE